jgi:hypothetical protein
VKERERERERERAAAVAVQMLIYSSDRGKGMAKIFPSKRRGGERKKISP